jgi:hypothetical protein
MCVFILHGSIARFDAWNVFVWTFEHFKNWVSDLELSFPGPLYVCFCICIHIYIQSGPYILTWGQARAGPWDCVRIYTEVARDSRNSSQAPENSGSSGTP